MRKGNYRWREDALVTFTSQMTQVRVGGESSFSPQHRVTIFHTDIMSLSEAGVLLALNGKQWLGVAVVVDPEVYPLEEMKNAS